MNRRVDPGTRPSRSGSWAEQAIHAAASGRRQRTHPKENQVLEWHEIEPPNEHEESPPPAGRPRLAWRRSTVLAIAGLLMTGGAGSLVLVATANAASPSSAPTTTQSAPAASSAPDASSAPTSGTNGAGNCAGMGGGSHETVTDTSVAAGAIGISESDLTTALAGGQTIAQVATAHDVDVQKVIDALVADRESELAEQVTSGELTQAQADQVKTGITAQVTDQVNSTFHGPGMDGHGRGGPGSSHGSGTPSGPAVSPAPSSNP